MKKNKFPWFPCFQDDLMGAIDPMDCYARCFYMCVLINIYSNGGPISSDARYLSRRTALSMPKVKACLDSLLASGKLIMADGMISNPVAEKIIKDREEKAEVLKKVRSVASESRWTNHSKVNPKKRNDIIAGGMQTRMQTGMQTGMQLHCKQPVESEIEEESKKEESKKEKLVQKENLDPTPIPTPALPPKRSRADRATRIPDDWKLTPEMGNYGRSRGLHHREVLNEAEKFVRYWKGKGGERGRKVDWKSTWENWCISAAERLGRVHSVVVPSDQDPSLPENFPRKDWEFNAMLYKNTSNWRLSWGPEPGPRCKMPADLQKQFISEPTPSKPSQGLTGSLKSSGGVGAGFLKELTSDALK